MNRLSPSPLITPRREVCAATLLLVLHVVLAVSSLMTGKSATSDEPFHTAGGMSYWLFNDYRVHPENGNLPQRLAGLGLILGRVDFPDNPRAWRHSDMNALGQQLLHPPDRDPQTILWHARWPIMVMSLLLCIAIWRWARELFGPLGGLVSLLLAALSPTLLAHGRLATSDTTAALFFLLACAGTWKLMHRVTPMRLLGASAAMTGLFLAKFSAPLIVGMAAIMLAIRLGRGGRIPVSWRRRTLPSPPGSRARLAGTMLASAALVTVATWAGVWMAYGLRYQAANDPATFATFGKFDSFEDATTQFGGRAGQLIATLSKYHILPEAYLVGICDVGIETRRRRAFWNGEHRSTGWAMYFPYTLLVKTPLGLFGVLACAATAVAVSPRRVRFFYRTAPLWSLLIVYWAAAVTSSFNIGHRHLLPTYPVMFILAGGAASWLASRPRRPGRFWITTGSLAAYMAAALWAWPHYLSYFNLIVGGPRQAHHHLVDSNLDWGQDLPAMARWMREHEPLVRQGQFWFDYFGGGVPRRYGIEALSIARPTLGAALNPLSAGVYAFSATRFRQTYDVLAGPWCQEYEDRYQAVSRWTDAFRALPPEVIQARIRARNDPARLLLDHHQRLRIARLIALLRQREPDDFAGYSILIYIVSPAEITQAQYGPPPELIGEPLDPEILPPLPPLPW